MTEPASSVPMQQLLELLAVLTSYPTEDLAVQGAVERAAQAFEAEVAAVIVDGRVIGSVGFPADAVPDGDLLAVANWERSQIHVPGMGDCHAIAAGWGGTHPGRLVLARCADTFSVEERGVARGMARLLELTLTMLRTLQAEHAMRERTEQLLDIQRAISRRQPLEAILRRITSAAQDVLRAETVGLWLRAPDDPHQVTLAAGAGLPTELAAIPLIEAGSAADAMIIEDLVVRPGSMAAPVYDSGAVAGALLVGCTRPDRVFGAHDRQTLSAFAEHVSIALTDANTVDRMRQAYHDSLTGLASRGLFLDRLTEQLDRAEPTALLYVDLDRFKEINDTLGHAAGDTLLTTTAQRLQAELRETDVAARIGGDEFAVLLKGIAAPADAIRVAERILRALLQPLPVAGRQLHINASIGIALCPPGATDPADLLRRADIAMYQAKRAGRHRYTLYTDDLLLTFPNDPA